MSRPPNSGSGLGKLLGEHGRRRLRQRPGKAASIAAVAEGEVAGLIRHGMALQRQGNLVFAAEAYQRALEKQPRHPDALHLMGTLALEAGDVDSALEYFKRAVAGKPNDPSIRCSLASVLCETLDLEGAELQLGKALKLLPNFAPALCLLAECKLAAGDHVQARRLYEEALQQAPNEARSSIGYCDLLITVGEVERARTLYRKAIELNASPALALAGLVNCEKLAKDSPEAREILRLLDNGGLRPVEHRRLSYAAAVIAENSGDYDEAFQRFKDAKRSGAPSFRPEAHGQILKAIRAAYTHDVFSARSKFGHPSTRPVFIVGMPRSGTSLVEQIISRHPQAVAAGELFDIGRLADSLGFNSNNSADYAKRVINLTTGETRKLAERYLATLANASQTAARVTDKMPHNFQHLGLIALLFPHAKIIHCRRDPLDTCVSCFTAQLKDHLHGYACDLETLGTYYREYASLMQHWREVLPIEIYELDYERLVGDPEQESRQLIDFIDLPWDSACLSPHESTRVVNTLSRRQVRDPIYRSSVGRWRQYERYLGPLQEALGDLVRKDAPPPD
jgi:tetratricopeptide (TPR) repeat protein